MSLTSVDWSTLPAPADDGAADGLRGAVFPPVPLPATDDSLVIVPALAGAVVLYFYPMTGRPDRDLPAGWDQIPGARGCTPQSCAYRDHFAALRAAGAAHVYGVATQTTAYQREAASRLHLPFPLLSDASGALRRALPLPTMDVAGDILFRRLTLILRDGQITALHYPVFPPDQDADWVIGHL